MSESVNPLPEGFVFPDMAVSVSAETQREKLACCGVDPAVYGGDVDVTAFAGEAIMATKHAGISINGSVHVGQYFDLRESIALGDRLTLRGRVTRVEDEPRGHLVTSTFELQREDGSIPLVMERTSLRIAASSETKGPLGKKRQAGPERDAMTLEAEKQLVPENVARYSNEADNLIHSDPEVARQFGFEAPIAGGLMAVRMMMEALAKRGPIKKLKMSVRFRRPMFWNERLEVRSAGDGPWPGAFAVFRSDGRVVNEATVHEVS